MPSGFYRVVFEAMVARLEKFDPDIAEDGT